MNDKCPMCGAKMMGGYPYEEDGYVTVLYICMTSYNNGKLSNEGRDCIRRQRNALRASMHRIVAMAGHPDAAEGCRLIIAEATKEQPDA